MSKSSGEAYIDVEVYEESDNLIPIYQEIISMDSKTSDEYNKKHELDIK